ncbi:MAG: site-specific tyrosine recombinase XerD [Acidimicrobiales bacterium]
MGTPLSSASEEYLSWLSVERGRARNTLVCYRRDIQGWEAWGREVGVDLLQATTGDLERYLSTLRSDGRNPASMARTITALRGLYRFLVDEGTLAADPGADLQSPRLPLRFPKALDEAQTLRLLDSVTGSGPYDLRDRALLELLYSTGARISEVVGLSLLDIGSDDGLLRVLGKGSKERMVPVGSMARDALDRWLSPAGRPQATPPRWASRDDSEAVFLNQRGGRLSRQGAWAILKRRADRVGMSVLVSPHVLRHSCATHMLAHGADIRIVQELLGHVSITTTQMYTKLTTEHLRAAYQLAHPRAGGHQDR